MNFIMAFSYVNTLCFAHMDLLMLFLSFLYTFHGSLPSAKSYSCFHVIWIGRQTDDRWMDGYIDRSRCTYERKCSICVFSPLL